MLRSTVKKSLYCGTSNNNITRSLYNTIKRPYSVHGPINNDDTNTNNRKKLTLSDLMTKYHNNEPITMLTATDFHSASVIDQSDLDMILVGDSLGMTALGYDTTVPVTMSEMIHHCKAVSRGVKSSFLVGDMPFGSYELNEDAIRNAIQFVKDGHMQAIKLEGGIEKAEQIKLINRAGVPVIGHIGLTPQSIHQLGEYKVVGKTSGEAMKLWEDALAVQDAGAKMVVMECVPHRIATLITKELNIPTIGIGSGPGCSGQVLVYHDILGMYSKFTPKFSKHFLNVNSAMKDACSRYNSQVKSKQFPEVGKHTFIVKDEALQQFKQDAGINTKQDTNKTSVNSKNPQDPIQNVVILGSGAVGTLLTAKIKEGSSVKVALVSGRPGSSDFRDAICVNSSEDDNIIKSYKNPITEPSDLPQRIDLLIIAVKNYATEQALERLLESKSVTSIGAVVTVQNGAGNCERIQSLLNKYNYNDSEVFQSSLYTGAKFIGNQKDLLEYTGTQVDLRLPKSLENSTISKLFTENKEFSIQHTVSDNIDWKKLIVNCVINPLTALYNIKNKEIADNPYLIEIAKGIISECIIVGKLSRNGTDQFSSPDMSQEQLLETVLSTARKTGANHSSMLKDLNVGDNNNSQTEIDSLNGYIVARALEVNFPTPYNTMMSQMVKAKSMTTKISHIDNQFLNSNNNDLSDPFSDHTWKQVQKLLQLKQVATVRCK
jgi:3-methyl-2-oxobutanoate hydroxymethyltransferase